MLALNLVKDWVVKTIVKHKVLASITCLTTALTIRYYTIKLYRKYKKYPPGPIGLPIVGSVLLMADLHKLTCKLPFKYGPIMYTTIGKRHFTLINSSKIYKQLAKSKDFVNRPIDIAKLTHQTVGFAFLNNDKPNYWTERRIDIKKSLLNTVTRTDYMEQNIGEVLDNNICNVLDECIKNNTLFYGGTIFRKIAFNNLLFTSFGYTLEYNDPLYLEYIQLSNKWVPRLLVGFLPFYIGFSKYLIKPYLNETIRLEEKLNELTKQMINRMDKSVINDCYVSNMLDEQNETYKKLAFKSKIADIVDMFAAATDTTSSSLTTTFILLAMNVDIQNEVREELLNTFKNSNNFTLKKIKGCPKFEALSYECLRLSNTGYMGLPHVIFKDTKVTVEDKEYIIPKDSVIVENITFIHDMSPNENWIQLKKKSKYDFNHRLNLYNFLEKDLETNKLKFKQNESFVYFGFGRRDCIGRQLAMKQLQFVIGQLLLKYHFQLSKSDQNIKQLKFKEGLVNRVKPVGLVIKSLSM